MVNLLAAVLLLLAQDPLTVQAPGLVQAPVAGQAGRVDARPRVPLPSQDRDAVLQRALDDWVAMWNSYDLDEVRRLFVADESVTYFSSERDGLIQGIDELVAHHEGFGFRSGGADTGSRLWLEDVHTHWDGSTAAVMATWLFAREDAEGPPQAGPVTFVIVARRGEFRILHAHFANAADGA